MNIKGYLSQFQLAYKTMVISSIVGLLSGCGTFTESGGEYSEFYSNGSVFASQPRYYSRTGMSTSSRYNPGTNQGRGYAPRPAPYYVTPKDEDDFHDLNANINQRIQNVEGGDGTADTNQQVNTIDELSDQQNPSPSVTDNESDTTQTSDDNTNDYPSIINEAEGI